MSEPKRDTSPLKKLGDRKTQTGLPPIVLPEQEEPAKETEQAE
jgi:hypothetical protein